FDIYLMYLQSPFARFLHRSSGGEKDVSKQEADMTFAVTAKGTGIAALIVALGSFASAAQAAPISGSVDVSAGVSLIGGTDFLNSTGLDVIGDDGIIANSSGDIAAAGFGFGDTGTQQDVCYAAG